MIMTQNWPDKKQFIKHMKWQLKILYYLFIIIPYKKMPMPQHGQLINDDEGIIKTLQGSTYSTYFHFNYFNPLTYVVCFFIALFILIIFILNSIFDTYETTKIITVSINDK